MSLSRKFELPNFQEEPSWLSFRFLCATEVYLTIRLFFNELSNWCDWILHIAKCQSTIVLILNILRYNRKRSL